MSSRFVTLFICILLVSNASCKDHESQKGSKTTKLSLPIKGIKQGVKAAVNSESSFPVSVPLSSLPLPLCSTSLLPAVPASSVLIYGTYVYIYPYEHYFYIYISLFNSTVGIKPTEVGNGMFVMQHYSLR